MLQKFPSVAKYMKGVVEESITGVHRYVVTNTCDIQVLYSESWIQILLFILQYALVIVKSLSKLKDRLYMLFFSILIKTFVLN